MTSYVIIGNGIAGISAIRSIRSIDKQGSITLLSDELHPFYYRPRLPEILSGEKTLEEITIHKPSWYAANRIESLYETVVAEIDVSRSRVITADGRDVAYDKLLYASGGYPFAPPLPGSDKAGVFTFRTAADAANLARAAADKKSVTIIGGGLLALEVGFNLTKRGLSVNCIEMIDRLLPRQLDYAGAAILQKALERKGFTFYLGKQVEKIDGRESAESVTLKSGETIPAGLVVICIGVRSHTELAKKTGLAVEKAVVADEYMKTSDGAIWTAGDAAQYQGIVWGLWSVAQQQGVIAGANMAGASRRYVPQPNTTSLKVTGIDVISSGIIDDAAHETVVHTRENAYRKLVLDKGKIAGCILLGDTTNDTQILRCMSEGIPIEEYKNEMLDPGFADWAFLDKR